MADHTFRNVIDGASTDALFGETYEVLDPSTGEVYAQAPRSGAADIDRAYAAADRAFETWGRTTPQERSLALLRMADALEARAQEFVAAECRDTGKPLHLTASEEMPPTVDHFCFFAVGRHPGAIHRLADFVDRRRGSSSPSYVRASVGRP